MPTFEMVSFCHVEVACTTKSKYKLQVFGRHTYLMHVAFINAPYIYVHGPNAVLALYS